MNAEVKVQIVMTNGCFDILHPGHLEYLERSSECGSVLLIGKGLTLMRQSDL